jgi:hypothetical protein
MPPKKATAKKAAEGDNSNENRINISIKVGEDAKPSKKKESSSSSSSKRTTNQGRVYGVRGARRAGGLLPPYNPAGTIMPPPGFQPQAAPTIINNIGTTGGLEGSAAAPTRLPYGDTVQMESAGSFPSAPTAQPYGNTVAMSDPRVPPPESPQASTASTAATRPPVNAAARGAGDDAPEPPGIMNEAATADQAFAARVTNRQRTAARMRRQMQQEIDAARVTQQVINEAVGNGVVDERDVNAQRALDWAQGETEREIAEEDPAAADLASAVARLSLGNKRGNRPPRDDLEAADGSFRPEEQMAGGTSAVAALTQVFDQPPPPLPMPPTSRVPGSTAGGASAGRGRGWRG